MNSITPNADTSKGIPSFLEAALAYARKGWRVVPLWGIENGICRCHKGAECGRSSGKHPVWADWPEKATTNPDTLTLWLGETGANIGVAAGGGLAVVDVDPRNGGLETLAGLEAQHGALPVTVTANTGGGGLHYYFTATVDVASSVVGPGLELKGAGGQVVAPPSAHLSGRRYEWAEGRSPDETSLAPLPEWLATWKPAPQTGAGAGENIPEGQRNTTLTSLAGGMRKRGMGEEAIRAALLAENVGRCSPPLADEEVAKIAASVAKYAPGEVESARLKERLAGPPAIRPAEARPLWLTVNDLEGDDEPIDWLCKGMVAREFVTLLCAAEKTGKTTALVHLVRAMATGAEFAGIKTRQTNVLYITEEPKPAWKMRHKRLGLAENLQLRIRPFGGARPTWAEWAQFCDEVAAKVKSEGHGLVILDTLAKLSPADDENDAAKVQRALNPLHTIAEAGAAVIVCHHSSKSELAAAGRAARGSSALTAFADIILELKPFNVGAVRLDKRRVIQGTGRFDEVPARIVIELTDSGYEYIGTSAEAAKANTVEAVALCLPNQPPGRTIEEIKALWPEDVAYGTLRRWLGEGVAAGRLSQTGSGKKGNPFRWHAP